LWRKKFDKKIKLIIRCKIYFLNFIIMNWINLQNFWITQEKLEKCERKVPIFSIFWQLNDEQLKQVDENWNIKAKLLTKEQLTQVEENLNFDYYFSKIHGETVWNVHKYL